MLDEVQEAAAGPLDVLEHQHERVALRDRFEEVPPRGERRAPPISLWRGEVADADERPELCTHPSCVRGIGDHLAHGLAELLLGGRGVVRLEDPCLCFHDLAQRPVREAVAVRGRAGLAPPDEPRAEVDAPEELRHQPALADPRLADDRDELRPVSIHDPLEGVLERGELPGPPDERFFRDLREVCAQPGKRRERLPHDDRLRLPPCSDRLGGSVADRPARREVGRLVDQDRVDRGGALEPRGGVHDVPPGHAFALARSGVERDERLAGGDAEPDVEVELRIGLVEDGDRVPHFERGPDRPFGIVAVRPWRSEQTADGVADELLDVAAEASEVVPDVPVVRPEHTADVFRVGAFRALGRADHVAEERGDDLSLLVEATLPSSGKGCTACAAEAEPLRIVAAAALARHVPGHVPMG
jgi:hypothetical protein